jgi:hypothetical protein
MGNIEFLLETFGEELANCSIEKLEEMAIRTNAKKNKKRLDDILVTRRIKLNDEFKWTPENRKKLLHLNDKLIYCFEKLKAEAAKVLQTVQNRIGSKDDFMHDFAIDAVVTPFFMRRMKTVNAMKKQTVSRKF